MIMLKRSVIQLLALGIMVSAMLPQNAQQTGYHDVGVGTEDLADGLSPSVLQVLRPSLQERCRSYNGLDRLARYYASRGDLEWFASSLAPSSKFAWYYADAFGMLDQKLKQKLRDEGQLSLRLEDSGVMDVAESVAYAKHVLGDPSKSLDGADIFRIIFAQDIEQIVALLVYIVAEQPELFPLFYESMSLHNQNRALHQERKLINEVKLDDRLLSGLVAATVLLTNECHVAIERWLFVVLQLGNKAMEFARVCQRQMYKESSDLKAICMTAFRSLQMQSIQQFRTMQSQLSAMKPRVYAIASQFRYFTEQRDIEASVRSVMTIASQFDAKHEIQIKKYLIQWMHEGFRNSYYDHNDSDTYLEADMKSLEMVYTIFVERLNALHVGQAPWSLQRHLSKETFLEHMPYYSVLILALQHQYAQDPAPPLSLTYQRGLNHSFWRKLMAFFSAYWNAVTTNNVKAFSELSLITKLVPISDDSSSLGPLELTSLDTVHGEYVSPHKYPNLARKPSIMRLLKDFADSKGQRVTVETLMGIMLFCIQNDMKDQITVIKPLVESRIGQSLDSVFMSPPAENIEPPYVKTARPWWKSIGSLKSGSPVASSERVDPGPFNHMKAYDSLSKFYESYKTANEQKQDTEVESAV
ncbi:hypothetical protein MIR68_005126 [Amoeboaphelidium protococcarum]|nr:hypothetical protein MIR68_005126 [Amoeboaphelidium protococcarum]